LAASDWVVEALDSAVVVDPDADVDDVDAEPLAVEEVEDAEEVEDVPVAAPPLVLGLFVVALMLSELSVVVNELSSELMTETLLLLIRVVPSLGRVVVGTNVSPAVVALAVPLEVDVVVAEASLLAVDVDDEFEVEAAVVDVVVVVVVVVVVAVVVALVVLVTENPGTTFRLGVK
jgi:hypothetical protein